MAFLRCLTRRSRGCWSRSVSEFVTSTIACAPSRPSSSGGACSANQRAVADVLESLPVSNGIHQAVLTLPAGAPPAALAQLAGESHATTAGALAGLALNARSVPLAQLRRNLNAAPSPGRSDRQRRRRLAPCAGRPEAAKPVGVRRQRRIHGGGRSHRAQCACHRAGRVVAGLACAGTIDAL